MGNVHYKPTFRFKMGKLITFSLALVIGFSSAPGAGQAESALKYPTQQIAAKGALAEGAGRSCQILASYLANSGIKGILGIKFSDIFKMVFGLPSQRKKRIKKDIGKILIGGGLLGVCPPLIVPQGFSQLGGAERLDYAIDTAWEPIESLADEYDVNNPAAPTSCSKDLAAQLGGQGQLLSGDFQTMEFVYVAPFGSYPNLYGHLAEGASRIQNLLKSFFNQFNGSYPPIASAVEDVQDFINSFDLGLDIGPSLNDLIPGLEDFILDRIAGGALFESNFRDQFDFWRSSLPALEQRGRISPTATGFAFPVGRTVVVFDSDISTGFSRTIRYTNSVTVNEYFAPTFNVLRQEPDPNDPTELLDIIAEYRYEALEPGGATAGITAPKFQQGSLAATDNCDSSPVVSPPAIAGLIPLGVNFIPVYATDASGNRSATHWAKVIVEDTLAPDVNPVDNIGIEVAQANGSVAFVSPGIGCINYLCQVTQPDRRVFPPVYFDFATITPVYECRVDNSIANDQDCGSALLPVGEQSIVRWLASDPSGNDNAIQQVVAVRPVGTNIPPVADGTQVTIAAGRTTRIPLMAHDAEFDPLSYNLRSLPVNGSLPVQPEPEFQTRFSLAGTLARFSSGLVIQVTAGGGSSTHQIVADPGNRRLLEISTSGGFVHSALFFDSLEPHSIDSFSDDPSGSTAFYGGVVADLIVADWSTRRVHTIVRNGSNDVADAGFDISPYVSNPSHIAWSENSLIITDPDPNNPSNGKLRVLQFSNVDPDNIRPAEQWVMSAMNTINLGFNAYGIHRSSCRFETNAQVILGDWDGRRAVRWDLGSNPASGNGSLDRQWSLNDLFVDPPGEQRADIGDPQDLYIASCGNSTPLLRIADDFDKRLKNVRVSGTGYSSFGSRSIGTSFEEILRVEATGSNEFVMLDAGRLVRYDLFGRLLAMVLTEEDPNQANQGIPQLISPSGLRWADLAVDLAGGNIFMLEGQTNVGETPQIQKISFSNGFANFSNLGSRLLQGGSDFSGTAVALSATNDRVYVVSTDGVERRIASSLLADSVLAVDNVGSCSGPWCAHLQDPGNGVGQFNDVAVDAAGNVYLSNRNDSRVYKFDVTGGLVGWLGRCSSGSNCDAASGRSYGFSCTNGTCGGSGSGTAEGQFDFGSNTIISQLPRYGRIDIDLQNNRIRVSDQPLIGGIRVPRIQTFSLAGEFENQTTPSDGPQTLIGNFTAVNDLSSADNKLYVVEGQPLKRLHVFDVNPFNILLGGATVDYTPMVGFAGADEFSYAVNDSFDDSAEALVQIAVLNDTQAPVINCPADVLDLEANTAGGARALDAAMAQAGSIILRDFLVGFSASDNIALPAVRVSHDAPSIFPLGDTLVTFTATDASNLESSCDSLVRIVDTIAPVIGQPDDLVYEATGELTTLALPAPTVVEIGGLQSFGNDGPMMFPLGEALVTWTAVDFAGQSSTAVQRVLVRDSTPPDLALPTVVRRVKAHGGVVDAAFYQVAANGYDNTLAYDLPQAQDAVAIGMPAKCFPAPGDSVAGSVVDVTCTVIDSSANITFIDFAVDVDQVDSDGDHIADFLQDGSGVFGDTGLAGVSTGYVLDSTLAAFAIQDAYRQDLGIRVDAYPDTAGVLGTRFCSDTIELRFDSLDNSADVGPVAASVSCALPRVEVATGVWQLTLFLPNGYPATMSLQGGDALSIDGYVVTAGAENDADILIAVAGNQGTLIIGGSIDLQSLANYSPTTTGIADAGWNEDAPTVTISLFDAFADVEDSDSELGFSTNIVASPVDLLAVSLNALDGTLELTSGPDNHGQAQVNIVATDLGGATVSTQFLVVVVPVNDPPSFVSGGDVVILEDRLFTPANWATGIHAGAANELDQNLGFIVTNDANELFAVAPAISPAGELSFVLTPDAFGSSTVVVQLLDDGGGNNASAVSTFNLAVTGVNDRPSFSDQGDLFLKPGSSGSHRQFGWAYDFDFGPENEAQQQVNDFIVNIVDDANQMIDTVSVTSGGDLRYVLTGRGGQAGISVAMRDNGGQTNGGNDTSVASQVWFNLPASTDLAVQYQTPRFIVSSSALQLILTVSNQSAEDVANAPFSAIIAPQLTRVSWLCQPYVGTTCPGTGSGTGDINLEVDLPAHSALQFLIQARVPDIPEQLLTFSASVMPSPDLPDFDLGDNQVMVVIPMALFMDGFDE